MKSFIDVCTEDSEVVKQVKGTRQKEQTGADVVFLPASMMLLTQVPQNS